LAQAFLACALNHEAAYIARKQQPTQQHNIQSASHYYKQKRCLNIKLCIFISILILIMIMIIIVITIITTTTTTLDLTNDVSGHKCINIQPPPHNLH
jgi:energy-coupling factor transporter transmembrane protein EcfT